MVQRKNGYTFLFIPEVIGKEIEKATSRIFPMQNVFIRKVRSWRPQSLIWENLWR
jgi:ribosomal protein S3AE